MHGPRRVAEPEVVSAEIFRARVLALLRPRHGSRPWPKKRLDRWILLYCAARTIRPSEELSEKDANQRLQDWLLGAAAHVTVDFVTLRRALIDEGLWDRESGGSRYRLSHRHRSRVRFDPDLPDELEVLAASE
jgi:hypothetical protein